MPGKKPRDLIGEGYEDILPICPCGCESVLAEDFEMKSQPVPAYAVKMAEEKGYSLIETERQIIRSGKFIKSPMFHKMRHMKLLMPWVTHDPNIVRLMQDDEYAEENKRRIHNMMGHASSAKTNFMVVWVFLMLDLWPENSEAFVASPYKNASDYLLWEAFTKMSDQLNAYGEDYTRKGTTISRHKDKNAGPGTVTLVSFHSRAVIRGKKMSQQGEEGRLMIVGDEIGEFVNNSILESIANLKSQKGFRMKTGTNFRDILGLDGLFNEPSKKKWTDLRREHDYRWWGINGGLTSRMRACVSPNMAMGVDYYPYLLCKDQHDDLLEYGKDSPEYLCQGDAFPSLNSVGRLLISEGEVATTKTYDTVLRLASEEKFLYVDPAFTESGDAAVGCQAAFGYDTNTGEQLISIIETPRFGIIDDKKWEEEDVNTAKALRKGQELSDSIKVGEQMNAYQQMSIHIGRYALEEQIPFANIGYDDSMRGILSHTMAYFLGDLIKPYYSGGPPDKRVAFPPRKIWSSEGGKKKMVNATNDKIHKKRVSQGWISTVGLIRSNYIRNGQRAKAGISDLCLRAKDEKSSGNFIDVETKDKFKDRNKRKSPDNGDALCGVCSMIVEFRFSPEVNSAEEQGPLGTSVIDTIMESGVRRQSKIKKTSR